MLLENLLTRLIPQSKHARTRLLLLASVIVAGCDSSTCNVIDATGTGFIFQVTPDDPAGGQGGGGAIHITITRQKNFDGPISFAFQSLPDGITGSFGPLQGVGSDQTVDATLQIAPFVTTGIKDIVVLGTGNGSTGGVLVHFRVSFGVPAYAFNPLGPTSVLQGGGGSAPISLRVNETFDFLSNRIFLELATPPAGISGTFSEEEIGAAETSTLNLVVGDGVPPGTYTLTVRGLDSHDVLTGSGTLVLTVTAFSIAMNPPAVNLARGSSVTSNVTITRTGFAGAIALSAENLSQGVIATFSPATTTGTTSVLTLTASASATVEPRTAKIRGTPPAAAAPALRADSLVASLTSRTADLAVTVTPPQGGTIVNVDFSGCTTSNRANWVAVQDGATGVWTRVTGSADVYALNLTQAKIGIAYTTGGQQPGLYIQYQTMAELAASNPVRFCHPPGSKTLSGTFAGIISGEIAYASFGLGANVGTTDGVFQLTQVVDGSHDLVAYKSLLTGNGVNDRLFFNRGLDPVSGGSVGTVAFAPGIVPVTALMTVAGTTGENVSHGMFYLTGNTCDFATLYNSKTVTGSSFTGYGAPAPQPATDFHRVSVSAIAPGNIAFRELMESFHTMGPRTLTLGSPLPVPSVTPSVGGYKLLDVTYVLPSEYQSTLFFNYVANVAGVAHGATITASLGWLGTATVLHMPDLSAVTAFDVTVPPPASSTGNWTLTATNNSVPSTCTEGARMINATRVGTY